MHIVVVSLVVAMVLCVLLLGIFGLFTLTPVARRIEVRDQSTKPMS
jgi:hypothetical protein